MRRQSRELLEQTIHATFKTAPRNRLAAVVSATPPHRIHDAIQIAEHVQRRYAQLDRERSASVSSSFWHPVLNRLAKADVPYEPAHSVPDAQRTGPRREAARALHSGARSGRFECHPPECSIRPGWKSRTPDGLADDPHPPKTRKTPRVQPQSAPVSRSPAGRHHTRLPKRIEDADPMTDFGRYRSTHQKAFASVSRQDTEDGNATRCFLFLQGWQSKFSRQTRGEHGGKRGSSVDHR